MSKLQKTCLIITILCSIHYAFYIIFEFDVFYTILYSNSWAIKLYAFVFGVSAFINILLFKKE